MRCCICKGHADVYYCHSSPSLCGPLCVLPLCLSCTQHPLSSSALVFSASPSRTAVLPRPAAGQPLISPPPPEEVPRRNTAPQAKAAIANIASRATKNWHLELSQALQAYEDWVLKLPVLPAFGRPGDVQPPPPGSEATPTRSGLQWYRCEAILLGGALCKTISLIAPFCNHHLAAIVGVSVTEIPGAGCGLVAAQPNKRLRERNALHPFAQNDAHTDDPKGEIFKWGAKIVPYCGHYVSAKTSLKTALHINSRYVISPTKDIDVDAWRTGYGPARYANYAPNRDNAPMREGIRWATAYARRTTEDLTDGNRLHPVMWLTCGKDPLLVGQEITYPYRSEHFFTGTGKRRERDYGEEFLHNLPSDLVIYQPSVLPCDTTILIDEPATATE